MPSSFKTIYSKTNTCLNRNVLRLVIFQTNYDFENITYVNSNYAYKTLVYV